MQQTKRFSMYETITSTAVGFVVAFILNMVVLPIFMNVHPKPMENFWMVVIFTIVSVIRGYGMRRLFNWLGWRKRPKVSVLVETDRKFLHWIYERLNMRYDEREDSFWMIRLKRLADSTEIK